MRATTNVVDDGNCSLIELFLIMVLIFNHIRIDEIAQIGAGVPAYVIGINVDFPELLDHFDLVGSVCFCARSGGGEIRRRIVVVMAIGRRKIDGGKGEGVSDLEG